MAITEIIEQLPGVGGSWDLQSGYSLTVKLKAKSDSRHDGPVTLFTALGSLGIRIGSTYRYPLTKAAVEEVPSLFVQNLTIDEVTPVGDGGAIWSLSVSYSRLDPSKDEKGPVDEETGVRDPFAAPPRLNWRSQVEEEAKMIDRDGEEIVNKAGQPFSPPIVIPRPVVTAVVRRVEREFNPLWIADYMGRINSSTWLGFAAGEVLCLEITSDREWNDEIAGWVWDTEYQFAFKKSVLASNGKLIRAGWAYQVLNAGVNYRDPVSGKLRACKSDDNIYAGQPMMLKSDGTQAAETDKPIYLTFNIYPTVDFAGLNMPADLFSAGTPELP